MNTNDATRATAEGMPKPNPVSDLCDLEGLLCDLASMSRILADLLDRELVDPLRSGSGNWSIQLTSAQMEILCFAWNDVANRALDAEKQFYAAVSGKAVAA